MAREQNWSNSSATGKESKTSYEEAEKQYADALERAKQRFREDSERDKNLLGDDKLPIPSRSSLPLTRSATPS